MQAEIARLREVVAFLLGEAPLDGHWYGDDTAPIGKEGRPIRYWWRSELREVSALLALAEAGNRYEWLRQGVAIPTRNSGCPRDVLIYGQWMESGEQLDATIDEAMAVALPDGGEVG